MIAVEWDHDVWKMKMSEAPKDGNMSLDADGSYWS